ncbi:PREDICTED: protein crumbs homolog 1-like [Branchiostoma belcheri]|uniref:Protein crumbs homolog 1-like n=1 Tax=Branchiostoma belcheri TaxID=7741 RepID=A0A6P5AD27_BRABE|nr:PREDICTED: protein crumbs homolog 1-like [Branchiostoma belcheri]
MTSYTLTHQILEGRPVYASDTTADFLYFYEPYGQWIVGPSVGTDHGWLYVTDSAMSPDKIQGTWKVSVDHVPTSFPSVQATCAECRQITISGSIHFQESRMTTYSLTSQIHNGRPVYSSDTRSDYIYYYAPYEEWMVGDNLGSSYRGLTAVDSHLYPEQVEAVWKLWDGSLFVPFPRVEARCTDIDDCASSPCQHGGICTDLHNSYSCTCAAGWEGDNCELDTNECETNACNTGYTCVNHIGYYVCLSEVLNHSKGQNVRSICGPESCADGWTCEARERGYACLSSQ